jgi:hypothetical protein
MHKVKRRTKTCPGCNKPKPLLAQYWGRCGQWGWQNRCKPCMVAVVRASQQAHPEVTRANWREQVRRKRLRKQEHARTLRAEGSCADCGYRMAPDENGLEKRLDFDHLPQFEKIADVSTMAVSNCSWGQFLAEIAKTELVCKPCHRARTLLRSGVRLLSPAEQTDIVTRYGDGSRGVTQKALAIEYGISAARVCKLISAARMAEK